MLQNDLETHKTRTDSVVWTQILPCAVDSEIYVEFSLSAVKTCLLPSTSPVWNVLLLFGVSPTEGKLQSEAGATMYSHNYREQ